MFRFSVYYPLETLTSDKDLVAEYKEKEKVVIKGKNHYNSFFIILSYLETIEGVDWYELTQYQQTRLQEQLAV